MSDKTKGAPRWDFSEVFTKIYWFRAPGLPEGKGFIVLQDKAGFFHLKRLVEREGLATPFSSIQELELALEMKLELVRERTIQGDESRGGRK